MFEYPATIIRWVDGDTAWLELDLGFRTHLQVDVRLAEINTPETVSYTLAGISDRAREFCESMCPPGALVIATIARQEKFGRWLAHIKFIPGCDDRLQILKEGKVLNNELIAHSLAKPYRK